MSYEITDREIGKELLPTSQPPRLPPRGFENNGPNSYDKIQYYDVIEDAESDDQKRDRHRNSNRNGQTSIVLCTCLLITVVTLIVLIYLFYPGSFEESKLQSSTLTTSTIPPATTTAKPPSKKREIKIYNKCLFTIWPGIQGPGNPENGGFRLNSGDTRSVYVDDPWRAARIWARTECDEHMNCATGSCGNRLHCQGSSGTPPATLAEFSLGMFDRIDFYDVSLIDGYNVPISIHPQGGKGTCEVAGNCVRDMNGICPEDFAVKKDGRTVACRSGCLAYNTDEDCCRGAFASPDKCKQTKTAKLISIACPDGYSYAYDDPAATFTCKNASYVVQFC